MQDGMEVTVSRFDGVPLATQLPSRVTLEVVEAPKSTKQGKSGDNFKQVVLENGCRLKVPHFIESGERVVISTADGTYVAREVS